MKKQPKFYKPDPIQLNPGVLHYGQENPYNGKETDFQKASNALIRVHKLLFAYHVPNESRRPGKSGDIERMMLKAQGVLSGVADWCIPYRTNTGHPGAYIELKAKDGKLSQDQINFLNAAFEQGYFCAVVWNLDALESLLNELYGKKRFKNQV
jgi:VRR-NUC domain